MDILSIKFLDADDYAVIVLRIGLAVLIGGTIGLERRFRGSPMGFRTYAIVSMASCILMLLSEFQWKILDLSPRMFENVRIDPVRMAQGVLTGIGFLGAGLVIKDKYSIRGLTTAAMIWLTSAFGLLVGVGFYAPVLIALVFTFLILLAHEKFENLTKTRYFGTLKIRITKRMAERNITEIEEELIKVIREEKFHIKESTFVADNETPLMEFQFSIHSQTNKEYGVLVDKLKKMKLVGMVQLLNT